MQHTPYMDSSGVGWLVNFHKHCREAGGMLVLHSIPPSIMSILKLLQMDRHLNMVEDEQGRAGHGVRSKGMTTAVTSPTAAATSPSGPNVAGLLPESAVATLIDYAVRMPASDLFFSINDNHVGVSVRHLGIVRLLTMLTPEQGRRCTSYIKVMAGMDLAEQRRPLDGRWVRGEEGVGAGRVDLRISTIPTLYGEDLAIRLLSCNSQRMVLDQIGMMRKELNELTGMLAIPSGLILVSGPTGSGKTTTLYACLRHLNNGERKINTIEDPIEYAIPGLRQSQINPKARRRIPRAAAERAPPVAGRDHDRRDPGPDHGRDGRARRQQRPPRAGLAARPVGGRGRAEPAQPGRPSAFPLQLAPGRDRPAAGPDALPRVQGPLRARRDARYLRRGPALARARRGPVSLRRPGLPQVLPDRLCRPDRCLRGIRAPGGSFAG